MSTPSEMLMTAEEFLARYGGGSIAPARPSSTIAIVVWANGEQWLAALKRVVGHLKAGVSAVVALHPSTKRACAFCENPPYVRGEHEDLTPPDVLPGFAVPVKRFFE